MSEYTKKLKLFKYEIGKDDDAPFSIERALNHNWDIIDEHITDTDLSSVDMVECAVVIKTYTNESSGYRIWSDGWCEQWGLLTMAKNATITIDLLEPYKDVNYSIFHSVYTTDNKDVWGYGVRVYAPTQNNFQIYMNSNTSGNVFWKTEGYLKMGTY